jgi:hypothetical protein
MDVTDLFDWQPPYPKSPGWTEPTTSRDAARRIAPKVQTLRDQVMVAYRAAWPAGLTADEVAAKIGKSILSVRPRVTELRGLGELMIQIPDRSNPKPICRKNESGADAVVLVCKKPEGNQP